MNSIGRREFVALAGAATVGAVVASAVGAQPAGDEKAKAASPKRTLRKAVMYGMITEGETVVDRFKMLRDAGFEGVEMDCPSRIPTEEILAAMDATGIKVHGLVDSVHWKLPLNSPDPGARDKAVDAMEVCLREGKRLGATSILLVPAIVNKDLAYDQAWSLSQQVIIQRMMALAKETGVKIAIENVWNNFLLSPLEAARYVDEINGVRWEDIKDENGRGAPRGASPVAFHFDIGNAINFGWPDQWVSILGDRIVKLHIKDFSRGKRDKEGLWKGFEVELGDGDAGWEAVMAALDRTGYSTAPGGNWATAEVRGGGAERLKQISSQMDRLFAM